jgi:hypothetical protein
VTPDCSLQSRQQYPTGLLDSGRSPPEAASQRTAQLYGQSLDSLLSRLHSVPCGLRVSPKHVLHVDGMRTPAGSAGEWRVDYPGRHGGRTHLEFDGHTVIFADGAPSESFVDDDSRRMFDNADEYARLYPDSVREPVQFCAPRVEQGWELQAVGRRLGRRAVHAQLSFDGGATTTPVSGAARRLTANAGSLVL